ncbi:immunogenic secreted isoform B [Micractinium conductrix]|nr:immunogenic secreted isoform B [Micractinium conductrix]|eukprot:PSC72896.1 immunogenic secreted isoform B [Micractinium conductrix]
MAILPGQLDVDCGSMLQSQATTSCPQACLATLSMIGPDCRQELLACEYKLNSAQEAYGLPAFWLWRPLFGSCGLDGASGGGMQSPQPLSPPLASPQPFSPQPFIPQPFSPGLVSPSPDDADLEGPLLPSCSLTVEAAEAAGWAGACSSDHGCLSLESGTLDDNCTAVLESPPLCTDGCHAALGSVGAACRQEILAWEALYNSAARQPHRRSPPAMADADHRLHCAAAYGNVEELQACLAAGADPDVLLPLEE